MEAASVAVLEICDKDPSKGKARYGSKSVAPLPVRHLSQERETLLYNLAVRCCATLVTEREPHHIIM